MSDRAEVYKYFKSCAYVDTSDSKLIIASALIVFKTIRLQNHLTTCQSTGSEICPAVNGQAVLNHTRACAHKNVSRPRHLTGQYHQLYDWFVLSLPHDAHQTQSWRACSTWLTAPGHSMTQHALLFGWWMWGTEGNGRGQLLCVICCSSGFAL